MVEEFTSHIDGELLSSPYELNSIQKSLHFGESYSDLLKQFIDGIWKQDRQYDPETEGMNKWDLVFHTIKKLHPDLTLLSSTKLEIGAKWLQGKCTNSQALLRIDGLCEALYDALAYYGCDVSDLKELEQQNREFYRIPKPEKNYLSELRKVIFSVAPPNDKGQVFLFDYLCERIDKSGLEFETPTQRKPVIRGYLRAALQDTKTLFNITTAEGVGLCEQIHKWLKEDGADITQLEAYWKDECEQLREKPEFIEERPGNHVNGAEAAEVTTVGRNTSPQVG